MTCTNSYCGPAEATLKCTRCGGFFCEKCAEEHKEAWFKIDGQVLTFRPIPAEVAPDATTDR